MWESVELRELRVFLALAEELHFGRAAVRLRVTPSRVSQSLRELERKLGGRLVHRTSRRVSLTPLGERFLADAGPAYDQLAGVLAQVRAASGDLDGSLRLGVLYPRAGGPHMNEIIEAFEERHPSCEVQLSDVLLDDPLGPVRRGEIDLMAARLPLNRPDLVVGPTLAREPRTLQVARDHPLAQREQVSIEDIADYPVVPLSGYPPETIEAVVPHSTPSGRPIRRRMQGRPPRTPYDVEALIARGTVVHPTVPSFADYYRHSDIVHVPISDMPPAEIGLVWHRRGLDPRSREFIRVAHEVLRATTVALDETTKNLIQQ